MGTSGEKVAAGRGENLACGKGVPGDIIWDFVTVVRVGSRLSSTLWRPQRFASDARSWFVPAQRAARCLPDETRAAWSKALREDVVPFLDGISAHHTVRYERIHAHELFRRF